MAVMMRTMLEVADNSGARKLQMILPLGGGTGLRARLGDVITASVKEAAPDGQVQKGKVGKDKLVIKVYGVADLILPAAGNGSAADTHARTLEKSAP